MHIAMAQINTTVGNLEGNAGKIVAFARRAAAEGAGLVVFPELCVTGYGPQDLLSNETFVSNVEAATAWIAQQAPPNIGILIGAPVRNDDDAGKRLYNAALLYAGGKLQGIARKSLPPTYDVCDQHRYFEPASARSCINWKGVRLGVRITPQPATSTYHPATSNQQLIKTCTPT